MLQGIVFLSDFSGRSQKTKYTDQKKANENIPNDFHIKKIFSINSDRLVNYPARIRRTNLIKSQVIFKG